MLSYAAVSSTGVYYATWRRHDSLWSYANGNWTELLRQMLSTGVFKRLRSIRLNPNEIVTIISLAAT